MKYSQANIFSDNGDDASDLKPSISVYGDLNLDEDEKYNELHFGDNKELYKKFDIISSNNIFHAILFI